ncbi:MAG: NAD-dependent epimerase/dehydratase family protein [Candidatus Atribacteria bacterium]|nr:MAG: NAD-dependent epimerase/dehydratase family protein [Candidatus Atribacteria bacterium]
MKRIKILVTGANGLVGKKLVEQLDASGNHEVYASP